MTGIIGLLNYMNGQWAAPEGSESLDVVNRVTAEVVGRVTLSVAAVVARAGNIGISIGLAATKAFFPFSGWKESFFRDLRGQGLDAVEPFAQNKIVIECWPKEWTRKF
jgi:acyl-CoA reductase-like NAD-dependent aldehyde dehydrogenase